MLAEPRSLEGRDKPPRSVTCCKADRTPSLHPPTPLEKWPPPLSIPQCYHLVHVVGWGWLLSPACELRSNWA